MWLWVIAIGAVLAAIVQGLTGFGSGIVMLIFLPLVIPIAKAGGVASLSFIAANCVLVWRYRHELNWRPLVLPLIVYLSAATLAIHLSQIWSESLLKMLLGGLLIGVAGYQSFFHRENGGPLPLWIGLICALISGFFGGMFGIGGPLMALYYLSLARSTGAYLASIQTFFLITALYENGVRFSSQILGFSDIRYIAVGMVFAILGTMIATRIVTHLDMRVITWLVYSFIGLSGGYYLVSGILMG